MKALLWLAGLALAAVTALDGHAGAALVLVLITAFLASFLRR